MSDLVASTAALVRVVHGGDWDNVPMSCRAARLVGEGSECRVGVIGFRLMVRASLT